MTTTPQNHCQISCRWEHPQKNRYYHVLLAKDLFGDWVITKAWGSIGKAQGRVVHLPFDSYVEAKKAIAAITTLRERRGYHVRGEIKNTTIKDG